MWGGARAAHCDCAAQPQLLRRSQGHGGLPRAREPRGSTWSRGLAALRVASRRNAAGTSLVRWRCNQQPPRPPDCLSVWAAALGSFWSGCTGSSKRAPLGGRREVAESRAGSEETNRLWPDSRQARAFRVKACVVGRWPREEARKAARRPGCANACGDTVRRNQYEISKHRTAWKLVGTEVKFNPGGARQLRDSFWPDRSGELQRTSSNLPPATQRYYNHEPLAHPQVAGHRARSDKLRIARQKGLT